MYDRNDMSSFFPSFERTRQLTSRYHWRTSLLYATEQQDFRSSFALIVGLVEKKLAGRRSPRHRYMSSLPFLSFFRVSHLSLTHIAFNLSLSVPTNARQLRKRVLFSWQLFPIFVLTYCFGTYVEYSIHQLQLKLILKISCSSRQIYDY